MADTSPSPHSDAPALAASPLRPWAFTVLGALAGLLIFGIVRPDRYLPDQLAIRSAGGVFVAVFALLLTLLDEPARRVGTVAFALVGALIVGLTTYGCGPFDSGGEPWKMAYAALGVAIATPLFQSWRASQPASAAPSFAMPYERAYRCAWSDAIVSAAACVFTTVVWIVLYLLGQLFELIGIGLLADLLGENWVMLTLTGAALGAGIGILRERYALLATAVQAVTTILALLAPLLALGLLIFLLAVPVTGLGAIWAATRSTSGIVLGSILAALVLANAVIGESEPAAPRHPALRASAAVLCLAILPLSLIAAISVAVRIQQHGLTPDRLWAVTLTAILSAYGLAYFVTVLRRRLQAGATLREDNRRLAIGLAVLSLLLASPLLNFGAISARDQVARLEQGRVAADRFDWGALRFDFGPPGEAAVRRLAKEGSTPEIREAAGYALKERNRWNLEAAIAPPRRPPVDPSLVTILPHGAKLPEDLYRKLSEFSACDTNLRCLVRYDRARGEAIIVTSSGTNLYRLEAGQWRYQDRFRTRDKAELDTIGRGLSEGNIEVRKVERRQVFINGVPVGDDFE